MGVERGRAVDGRGARRPTARGMAAAIAIVSLPVVALLDGLHLVGLFGECPGRSESFGWLKLLAGTCLLVPGFVAAVTSRVGTEVRFLLGLHGVCALPLLAAWLSWLDPSTGCT